MRNTFNLVVLIFILIPKFATAYCIYYYPKPNIKAEFKVAVSNYNHNKTATYIFNEKSYHCWNKEHLKRGPAYLELIINIKKSRNNDWTEAKTFYKGKTTAAGKKNKKVKIVMLATGYAEIYPKSANKVAVNVYYTPDIKIPKTYYVEF